MPLQACYECTKQVSSTAATCPNCGAPIANRYTNTTIQRTDKRLKVHIIIGGCILALGVLWVLNAAKYPGSNAFYHDPFNGVWIVIGAAIYLMSTQIRIWWHHE